ncbi:hypothetical protein ARC20_10030 [Stenotrophomonas panacihumi]|uniref:Uncharacterized protein n=2 Tax=Stenotrophomonas panacihumi TaxID=676599 RepID=A0A0R0AP17_9GAMM|nr:hypothetical protein ARC20_10030 [Stenotrophomonas panacihumi]
MYDDALASQAKFLVAMVRQAILSGSALPSPNVFLSEPKYASGHSADQITDSLFLHTVPLARARRIRKLDRTVVPQHTADVRHIVFAEMRRIGGLHADRIISSERRFAVQDGERTHFLDIPLQTDKALGTIISTQYAARSAELQLLRADNDLQIAKRLYRQDRLLMYVVRGEPSVEAERFDDLLGDFRWKFSKLGVEMKDYSEPSLVAADVLEDMKIA